MNKKVLNIIISICFIGIIAFLGVKLSKKNSSDDILFLSAQLEEKESKIDLLNEKVEEEKKLLKELQKEYEEYKDNNSSSSVDISSLEEEIASKASKISNLENQIKDLKNSFLVVYVADNNIISTQYVKKNGNVSNIPNIPKKNGYTSSWSKSGTNIVEDTVIFANYSKKIFNIHYVLDYAHYIDLKGAEFNIGNNKYVYFNEYKFLAKTISVIGQDANTSFNIDGETFTFMGNCVQKTSNSEEYYGDEYIEYFIFDYNNKKYLIDKYDYKVYECIILNVRDDLVFIENGIHYRIGGDEFKVYSENNSYTINRLYFLFSDGYYVIKDNVLYSLDTSSVANVVNNKFEFEDIEYTLDSHYLGIKNVITNFTYKNSSILPFTYKFGDKLLVLPNIKDVVNNIDEPRSGVYYATPTEWKANLVKINGDYYLLEDDYGDIYIYIQWMDFM